MGRISSDVLRGAAPARLAAPHGCLPRLQHQAGVCGRHTVLPRLHGEIHPAFSTGCSHLPLVRHSRVSWRSGCVASTSPATGKHPGRGLVH